MQTFKTQFKIKVLAQFFMTEERLPSDALWRGFRKVVID